MSDISKKLPITIRPALQEDVPFIFSSWLKSYNFIAREPFKIADQIYYTAHHNIIEKILKRSTVLIACDPKDNSSIFGYIVAEYIHGIPTIHYVYIKHLFRKLGVGKSLLNCLDIDLNYAIIISHMSKQFHHAFNKYGNFIYNPYILHDDKVETATISYKAFEELNEEGDSSEIKD